MIKIDNKIIIEEFLSYLNDKAFPCVAAKAAAIRRQVQCMVAEDLSCIQEDDTILQFLYNFVDVFKSSKKLFHSAAIIFKKPEIITEEQFDELLWQKLQNLIDLDAKNYSYDKRVSDNPASPHFSFSLKEEAFFVIGLHHLNSRPARRFIYPVMVFNPHVQFEKLREEERYEQMKNIVRKRDVAFSGSVNPMLDDFGKTSEVYQYSGREYDKTWQCPLKIKHAKTNNHSSS